jgi:hypothetical protein
MQRKSQIVEFAGSRAESSGRPGDKESPKGLVSDTRTFRFINVIWTFLCKIVAVICIFIEIMTVDRYAGIAPVLSSEPATMKRTNDIGVARRPYANSCATCCPGDVRLLGCIEDGRDQHRAVDRGGIVLQGQYFAY